MRARVAHIFAVSLLALTTACASDDATGVDGGGLNGTFTLQTINGATLPFAVRDDATGKFEVMTGKITLGTDGRFTDEMAYQITPVDGAVDPFTETLTGRFMHDVELKTVFFEIDNGGGVYDLSVGENGKLMQLVGDFELVYGK